MPRRLVLTAATCALVCLLFTAERRLGLHQSLSTRYRFHAIPVAVSTLYHNRPHDYTAHRSLAMSFHDAGRDIDEQIREAIRPESVIDGGTYYWVADDRGLADFVVGAFWLFGPQVEEPFGLLVPVAVTLACLLRSRLLADPGRTRRAACGHIRLAGDRIDSAGSPPVPECSGILGRGDRASPSRGCSMHLPLLVCSTSRFWPAAARPSADWPGRRRFPSR